MTPPAASPPATSTTSGWWPTFARDRVLTLLAGALLLGGCGEDRGNALSTVPAPVGAGPAPAGVAAQATTEVSLTDFRLPDDPRIPRPGTIGFEVTNDGQSRHALAVDGPAGEVSTPSLAPGERRTIATRLPPGTYKWYCPIGDHELRGMVGRVRVAE